MRSVSADLTASGRLDEIGIYTVSGAVLLDVHGSPRSLTVNSVSGDPSAPSAPRADGGWRADASDRVSNPWSAPAPEPEQGRMRRARPSGPRRAWRSTTSTSRSATSGIGCARQCAPTGASA